MSTADNDARDHALNTTQLVTDQYDAAASETELRVFHNRLRILSSIDRHELVEAGILTNEPSSRWNSFVSNPYLWLIRCSDDDALKIWAIIRRRECGK